MFFILSKILSFLLTPLTWIILVLLRGVLIRNPKKSKRWILTALFMMLFFTNSPLIDELVRLWEWPMTPTSAIKQYDAGIVLGGGMVTYDNDYDRLIFRENTDRILQAVNLYKKGHINKIVIAGGPGSIIFADQIEGLMLRDYITAIGIPPGDVIVDSTSNNTHENAVNTTAIVRKLFPNGNILVITSALHMKRSLACFANEGLCVTGFATNKITGRRRADIGYYLLPDVNALDRWEKYIHEVSGYVMYAFMGYI